LQTTLGGRCEKVPTSLAKKQDILLIHSQCWLFDHIPKSRHGSSSAMWQFVRHVGLGAAAALCHKNNTVSYFVNGKLLD